MKKISWMNTFVWLVWIFPIAYLIYVWSDLPAVIPVHYDLQGNADRMGSKKEMAVGVCILSILSLGVYFLLKYLPKIDPKQKNKYSETVFVKIGQAIVLLLSAIAASIVYSTVAGKLMLGNLILPALGLFFAYLGNIMHSVKPNYFAGVRTPWTLDNEGNWKSTHRLASKIWFAGGIVIVIGTLLLPFKIGFIFFISVVSLITAIPVIHSYRFYKKNKQ